MRTVGDEWITTPEIRANRIPCILSSFPPWNIFRISSVEVATDAMGYRLDFLLEESVEVIADPEQLRKGVLDNIISDAIKVYG